MIDNILKRAKEIGLYQVDGEIEMFLEFLLQTPINNVLEIGAQDGGTFYLWNKISKPDGIKIALDLPNGPYTTRGLSPEQVEKRDAMIRSWGPNVHVLNMDSGAPTTVDRVRELLGGKKVDLLFIDGDHRYEGVSRDFSNYQQFVNVGGFIAFHDIVMSTWHTEVGCQVGTLWGQLKTMCPVTYEFGPFNQEWGGIGVIQYGLDTYPQHLIDFITNHNT